MSFWLFPERICCPVIFQLFRFALTTVTMQKKKKNFNHKSKWDSSPEFALHCTANRWSRIGVPYPIRASTMCCTFFFRIRVPGAMYHVCWLYNTTTCVCVCSIHLDSGFWANDVDEHRHRRIPLSSSSGSRTRRLSAKRPGDSCPAWIARKSLFTNELKESKSHPRCRTSKRYFFAFNVVNVLLFPLGIFSTFSSWHTPFGTVSTEENTPAPK